MNHEDEQSFAVEAAPEDTVVEDSPPKPDYPIYRIEPAEHFSLAYIDPNETEHYERKKEVRKALEMQRRRLQELQARLYAENERGLLIVLQAMDTGGKDGTIKHVFSGVNPQGCRVSSFKAPNPEESNHDFLWRYHKSAPARGRIGIFNRSHYEDVLVVRVKNLVSESMASTIRPDQRLRVQPHPKRYPSHQVLPAHL